LRKQILGAAVASVAAAALVAAVTASGGSKAASVTTVSARGQISAASVYNGRISRSEIISRAGYWYAHRGSIPYSWTRTYRDPDGAHAYRTDCSGFVSMALHLSPSGLGAPSTVSLVNYGVRESRTSMQMGDFTGVLGAGTGGAAGHVRLFEKWANKAAGTYWAYDFGSTPVKHQIYRLSTDLPRGGHAWTAYRYKNAY
jgi:hypothetical protein